MRPFLIPEGEQPANVHSTTQQPQLRLWELQLKSSNTELLIGIGSALESCQDFSVILAVS